MGSLGVPELIVIFLVALIVFGPKKLPELGRSLGKSLAEFKRASNELKNTLEEEIRLDERRQAAPPTTQQPPTEPTIAALPPAPPSVPAPADTFPREQSGS